MIVDVHDSGVLELFWRHPICRNPSHYCAQAMIATLGRSSDIATLVRPWCTAPRGNNGPKVLMKRLCDGVASREFVLLQHRGELRWHGTRQPVVPAGPSMLVLRKASTHPQRNVSKALDWIQDATHEQANACWKILWRRYGRSDAELTSVKEFAAEAQRLVESGELVPIFHPLPVIVQSVIVSEPVQAGGYAIPEPPAVEPDKPTFSTDHTAAEQVSALIDAAESGIPFCEVCRKEDANRRAA